MIGGDSTSDTFNELNKAEKSFEVGKNTISISGESETGEKNSSIILEAGGYLRDKVTNGVFTIGTLDNNKTEELQRLTKNNSVTWSLDLNKTVDDTVNKTEEAISKLSIFNIVPQEGRITSDMINAETKEAIQSAQDDVVIIKEEVSTLPVLQDINVSTDYVTPIAIGSGTIESISTFEGAGLVVSADDEGDVGTVRVSSGNILFTPRDGFDGLASIAVTVPDGRVLTVNVTVEQLVNTQPAPAVVVPAGPGRGQ